MAEPAARRGFPTPPAVTQYFDGKTDRPAFSWLDVWAEEHAYAFTVAKAVDAELLGVFRRTIAAAIADSRTFDNWREEIAGELKRLGWFGARRVADPAGADSDALVDFSSRRRLSTIFHANMRAARAAGQWERIQRTKRGLPYLLYVRTAAAEPRAEHLGWVGIILPVDHPFWATHFPPNGWGCQCSVRQITRAEAAKLLGREPEDGGIVYRDEPPDDGPPRQFRNRRTGEITEVPAGIDPGWHTNPGLARARTLIDNLSAKLDAVPGKDGGAEDAARIVAELWADPFLAITPKLPKKTWLPAGVSRRLAAALEAKSPIVAIDSEAVAARLARHQMTIEDFSALPQILASAAMPAAAHRPVGETAARTLFHRAGRTWWRAIVVRSGTGLLRVRSLHQRSEFAVAAQILDAGLGRDGLITAGFEAERATLMIERWKERREGGITPVG